MSIMIALYVHLAFPRSNDLVDKQVESLISDALVCIDNGEFDLARLYIQQAYNNDMSPDSLWYFMAKIDMYEGSIQEALLYNSTMNPEPTSSMRRMQLEQRYAIYSQIKDSVAAAITYDSLVIAYENTKRNIFIPGFSVSSMMGIDFLRERQGQDFSAELNPEYLVIDKKPGILGNVAFNLSWKTDVLTHSNVKFGLNFKLGKSSGSNLSQNSSLPLVTFYNNMSKSLQPYVQWNNIGKVLSVSGAYSLFKQASGKVTQSAYVNTGVDFSIGSWFYLFDLGVYSSINPLLLGSVDFFAQFDQTYLNEHGFILSVYSSYINGEIFNAGFSEPQSIFYNDGWKSLTDYTILILSDNDTCSSFSDIEACQNISKTLFFNVHPQQLISVAPKISYRFSPFQWLSIETGIGYQYDFYLKLSRWLDMDIPVGEVSDMVYDNEIYGQSVDVVYDDLMGNYFIKNQKTGSLTGILKTIQKRRIDHLPSVELVLDFNTGSIGRFELELGFEKTFSSLEPYIPVEINDYAVHAYINWYFSIKS